MFHNALRNHSIRFVIVLLALLGVASWLTFRTYSHGENTALSLDRGAGAARAAHSDPAKANEATRLNVSDAYGKLPLSFEINRGQTNDRVKFLSRGSGYSLFLTSREAVLALESRGQGSGVRGQELSSKDGTTDSSLIPDPSSRSVLRTRMVGANPSPQIEGRDQLPGKSNYFIGNDPAKWRTNVPNYKTVHYREIYPGIDLDYYGNQQQLEYDFVIAPGASARRIKMSFEGARRMRIDKNGDLVIKTAGGEIRQLKPVVYQEVDGVRREVAGRYVILGRHGRIRTPHSALRTRVVGFKVGAYDHSLPLVIDPTLVYSTFLGGTGNEDGNAIAVDALGNAYVAGATYSTDFPTSVGAFQTTNASDPGLGPDGFITKLNPPGDQVIYSTYLGGSCTDHIEGIAVNNATGEAYVTGTTSSGINPQINQPDCGPFQNAFQAFPQVNAFGSYGPNSDAFVTKLNATGNALVFSSFLGGNNSDFGYAIAVDGSGNAYVTGDTISTNFPNSSTNGSLPASYQTGNVGSSDAFVTKVGPTGTLLYSTYFGGGGLDSGRGITVDGNGYVYVTGKTSSGGLADGCAFATYSPGLPTTNGAFQPNIAPSQSSSCQGCCLGSGIQYTPNMMDAFVVKLKLNQGPINPNDPVLVYGTYLGGGTQPANISDGAFDEGHAIALDSAGNVYVTGSTGATNFPTSIGAYQTTYQGGSQPPGDAFVTKLQTNGSGANDLVYSTYLGGVGYDEGNGIAVNSTGEAYVGGTGGPPQVDSLTPCPLPPCLGSGVTFVTKFNANGQSVIYSTEIFGASYIRGLALDLASDAYVTGTAQSGLTTTPGVFQPTNAGLNDAFVAKISDAATEPQPSPSPSPTPTASPTCVPPPPNMVSWWPGDGNAFDIQDSNHGTLVNGAGFAPGKVGQALSFNGINQDVFIGNPANLKLTNAITIDAWINPSAGPPLNDLSAIVTKWAQDFSNTQFSDSYGLWLFNDGGTVRLFGAVHVPVVTNINGNEPHLQGGVIPLNTFSHVAMTYDGTTGHFVLYVNGQPVASGDVIPASNIFATDRNVAIGHEESPAQRYFAGLIDEVEVFDRALSPSEIAAIFNSGSAGKCQDQCPDDPNKTEPGICGCGVPDTDNDQDGTPDCNDACPSDPNKINPGVCGCGVPDADSDNDGTPNCIDQCPTDPGKVAPGVCGCGVPDTDSDGDGVANCLDNCPTIINPNQEDEDQDGVGDACAPVDACTLAGLLDSFNRANGSLGSNWRGLTGTAFYRIRSNRLDVQLGGPVYWNAVSFGTSQSAFVTLSTVDTHSPSQGLLLKVQSSSVPQAGAIAVVYDAQAHAVRVSTFRPPLLTWKPYPSAPVTFGNGDKLGACVKSNGVVTIYKNNVLVATVTLNAADKAFFNSRGGKVGLWTSAAPNAFFDNFGGGTVTP